MSNFTTLKANAQTNLDDSAVTYTTANIDAAAQDAYDDVASQTKSIVKKTTLSWTANLSYYDLATLVSDYMSCVAIFNNVNNQWLDDDLTLRDLDSLRIDWELATGTPLNWMGLDHKRIAIFPRYTSAAGTFDLYYWGKAPTIVDANVPLIPTDLQSLITQYITADALEGIEEFSKASVFWDMYFRALSDYKERSENLIKTDLLFRI
jgi:hypothetical protein